MCLGLYLFFLANVIPRLFVLVLTEIQFYLQHKPSMNKNKLSLSLSLGFFLPPLSIPYFTEWLVDGIRVKCLFAPEQIFRIRLEFHELESVWSNLESEKE